MTRTTARSFLATLLSAALVTALWGYTLAAPAGAADAAAQFQA